MKPARKTYWHLGADRRLPSDYEITTSRLLYYVDRGGFAVNLPSSDFYARNQGGSLLVSKRWEELADPRATTYTKYVDLAREREVYVGRLLSTIEESDYDRGLPGAWLETLGGTLSPLRFLCHGLQMVAAYIGQMAPSGRIAVAALFQCGDEIRRIQRFAYRIALLARQRPEVVGVGGGGDIGEIGEMGMLGRRLWQSDPRWQPLRRAIETLLVTYDWGEALVALNVCLKPMIDDLFLVQLAELADQSRDHVDAQILRSLFEDCAWHRAWTAALLELASADRPENGAVVARWIDAWTPTVEAAARAGGVILGRDRRPAHAVKAPRNKGEALG